MLQASASDDTKLASLVQGPGVPVRDRSMGNCCGSYANFTQQPWMVRQMLSSCAGNAWLRAQAPTLQVWAHHPIRQQYDIVMDLGEGAFSLVWPYLSCP